MSDPNYESKKPNTIGIELVMPLLQKWVEVKLLFLEKLKQRIQEEKDIEKTIALRAELNEVLLNDADIDQVDARLMRIATLMEKHKAMLIEMFKEEGRDFP